MVEEDEFGQPDIAQKVLEQVELERALSEEGEPSPIQADRMRVVDLFSNDKVIQEIADLLDGRIRLKDLELTNESVKFPENAKIDILMAVKSTLSPVTALGYVVDRREIHSMLQALHDSLTRLFAHKWVKDWNLPLADLNTRGRKVIVLIDILVYSHMSRSHEGRGLRTAFQIERITTVRQELTPIEKEKRGGFLDFFRGGR